MAKVGLSSPWVQFYYEVDAFFKSDPEVAVVYDEEKNILNLYVDNAAKADALAELLPIAKKYGSVTLYITIIPSNKAVATKVTKNKEDRVIEALRGNASVAYVYKNTMLFDNSMTYIVFKPEVIQYFTDSLGDAHGICSTLNQEIAKDIFGEIDGVFFCTDLVEGFSVI